MSIEQEYAKALAQFRQEKDDYFRSDPDAPIPAAERLTFAGLRYYPPFFALRLVARVERLPQSEAIQMATSDGAFRPFVKAALLHFTIDGQEHQLAGYQGAEDAGDEDAAIFIPFRDALSGKETYGAGRYMDVHAEHAGMARSSLRWISTWRTILIAPIMITIAAPLPQQKTPYPSLSMPVSAITTTTRHDICGPYTSSCPGSVSGKA